MDKFRAFVLRNLQTSVSEINKYVLQLCYVIEIDNIAAIAPLEVLRQGFLHTFKGASHRVIARFGVIYKVVTTGFDVCDIVGVDRSKTAVDTQSQQNTVAPID